MKILLIDNYDSFTYNLYQQIGELLEEKRIDGEVVVRRNDAITIHKAKQFDRIILSPGPGNPADRAYFGVCADILQKVQTIPVLGVCLGMQGMAHYFGGNVTRAKQMMHGKTSVISHDGKGIFAHVPQHIEVMRYHSLIADVQSLPSCLTVSATVDTEVMGLRHKLFPIEGVQFHPESFATEAGKIMLSNFLFGGKI